MLWQKEQPTKKTLITDLHFLQHKYTKSTIVLPWVFEYVHKCRYEYEYGGHHCQP